MIRQQNEKSRLKKAARTRLSSLALLMLPTLAVVAAVLLLMNWRVPTLVQLDIIANRVVFTVDGTDSTPILNSVHFQSITFEKFSRITFSPERLEVADPAQYKPMEDRYPDSAWRLLSITAPVEITPEDETLQPAVTLESARPGENTAVALDHLWARPGADVTLEVKGTKTVAVTVKVDGQESSAALSLREPFHLMTHYGRISGITNLFYKSDSLTYRAQLPDQDRFVKIIGRPGSLVVSLTIGPEETTEPFAKGPIPIKAFDLTRQSLKGDRETTLLKEGGILYPEYPKIERVSFKSTDLIGLDRLEKFRIEEIGLDAEQKGIRLRLKGIAGYVKTGSRDFSEDHRLTRFETIRQNPRLMVLFGIIGWVFPTTLGARRLYKELKELRS